ncbi:MAG: hypothetical protein ACI9JN_000739 [Bacteroidia bacterium]|jgi:hypothetical protein
MNIMDFFIGLTLMNAMPHFILGIWKQPMLSGFGLGNMKNIVWGLTNLVISIGLFLYKYGLEGIKENGIYAGGLLIVVTFVFTSKFWRNRYLK